MPETKQFREFVVEKQKTEEDNSAIAWISTDTIDRDKEVLLPKGVDFENYNKNPVVLWAHDYSGTPVGKTQWVKQGRKYIKAKWEWADTDKAQEIKQLWDGGFLNAVSVGFIVSKSHEPTPDDIKKTPEWAEVSLVIDEWELLEFSIVPVPANPAALVAAVKELNISEATQKELGIDTKNDTGNESVTVYTVGVNSDKPLADDVKVDTKKDEPIIVVPRRILRPHRVVRKVRVIINPKDVTKTTINMLKGRIYM